MTPKAICSRIALAFFALATAQAFGIGVVSAPVWWWGGIAAGLFFRELGEVVT